MRNPVYRESPLPRLCTQVWAWQDSFMAQDDERQVAKRLVEQIRQGSEVAEASLVKRYSRGLFFLLRAKVHDPESARDLCQETLYRAIEKLRERRLDEPEKLSHWLARFANNLAANHVRKEVRRQTFADDELAQRARDRNPGPEAMLSRAQSTALVRELIQELKLERDRQILQRTYEFDQNKEQIIAEVDGLDDAGDYHRVLHRAKARLRELIIERAGSQALSSAPPRKRK